MAVLPFQTRYRTLTKLWWSGFVGACLLLFLPTLAKGSSQIFEAIAEGDCDRAAFLIDLDPRRLDCKSRGGIRPLHLAVELNDINIVRLLLENGADADCSSFDGTTPLMVASKAGNFEMVQILYTPWRNLNATDRRGFTVMHHAAISGCCRTLKFLYSKGADINARTANGATPLSFAIVNNHEDAITLITRMGGIQ